MTPEIRSRLLKVSDDLTAAFNGFYHDIYPERTGPALLKAIEEIRSIIGAKDDEGFKPHF
jgi:hypothetical protein